MLDLKKVSHKIRGDLLEVKLVDITFSTYFKGSAHINNPKEMRQLIESLKEKGVSFMGDWF